MGECYMTEEMVSGKIKCPVCGKIFLLKASLPTKLEAYCTRCKTYVKMILQVLPPWFKDMATKNKGDGKREEKFPPQTQA